MGKKVVLEKLIDVVMKKLSKFDWARVRENSAKAMLKKIGIECDCVVVHSTLLLKSN